MRIAKHFCLSSLAVLILLAITAPRSVAQFIGFTSPQTVNSQPFGSIATACTGSPQKAVVQNLGQAVHYISYTTVSTPVGILVQLFGSFDGGTTTFLVSDSATSIPSGQLQASGYYPQVYVVVTCNTALGSFIVNYAGTSVSPSQPEGVNLQSVIVKTMVRLGPMNANAGPIRIPSPFGNSAGVILFSPNMTPPSGSSVTILCDAATQLYSTFSFPISSVSSSVQSFNVPSIPCLTPQVSFTSGGATAGLFTLLYEYYVPGLNSSPTPYSYANITTNMSTLVKSGSGILHTLVFNTLGTGESLTIYDSTSCSGTKIATVTVQTTDPFKLYDIQFIQGLCVVTAGGAAGDYTVSYQ